MCQPARGKATEVSKIGIKQLVRLSKVFRLNQPALVTHQNAKWKPLLRFVQRSSAVRLALGSGAVPRSTKTGESWFWQWRHFMRGTPQHVMPVGRSERGYRKFPAPSLPERRLERTESIPLFSL